MHIMIYLMQLLRKVDMIKSKNNDRFTDLENEINELKEQIDFLYNLVNPSSNSLPHEVEDDYYDGTTKEIPCDIYDEIRKYCENKNFIFMGLA